MLSLVLDPVLRVAGEDIKGEVCLDFRLLQKTSLDEVYIKFRGSIFTYV